MGKLRNLGCGFQCHARREQRRDGAGHIACLTRSGTHERGVELAVAIHFAGDLGQPARIAPGHEVGHAPSARRQLVGGHRP